jgi:alkanesulfonate monooxygenase SsuD/methylene tetrahydromethanopterin reductase-like flavin-dependent oxidoreductase (luciferase family)
MGLLAERAGWDGVFTWEAAYGVDPWTVLAAIAARTSRVSLGTMLTPLPWRRPWKVASQVATLDQISGGRAILAVGVGATDTNLPDTGEETGIRARAEMLDEGIDLIRALWEGHGSYDGRHYRYHSGRFDLVAAAKPVQERIPIWVVGVWPGRKSMRRVLRCDGLIPQFGDSATAAGPDGARAARNWLSENGASAGLDVIADGETPAGDRAAAAAQAAAWAKAGCTWWLETRWGVQEDLEERMTAMRERLEAGPPRDAGGPR